MRCSQPPILARRAEQNADGYAMGLLRDAAISPAATAAFFRRLGKGAEGPERMLAYLNTHPVSADRAAAFAASRDAKATYRPALDAAQWAALKNICRGTKEESGWRF
ncbi:M48 family metalloprotease [Sphingomonas sp.]|uniref:M48 family metalloprotease n=1 Tax=Sphingomonas sp. TaxID=28214 RepID=UPI003B004758